MSYSSGTMHKPGWVSSLPLGMPVPVDRPSVRPHPLSLSSPATITRSNSRLVEPHASWELELQAVQLQPVEEMYSSLSGMSDYGAPDSHTAGTGGIQAVRNQAYDQYSVNDQPMQVYGDQSTGHKRLLSDVEATKSLAVSSQYPYYHTNIDFAPYASSSSPQVSVAPMGDAFDTLIPPHQSAVLDSRLGSDVRGSQDDPSYWTPTASQNEGDPGQGMSQLLGMEVDCGGMGDLVMGQMHGPQEDLNSSLLGFDPSYMTDQANIEFVYDPSLPGYPSLPSSSSSSTASSRYTSPYHLSQTLPTSAGTSPAQSPASHAVPLASIPLPQSTYQAYSNVQLAASYPSSSVGPPPGRVVGTYSHPPSRRPSTIHLSTVARTSVPETSTPVFSNTSGISSGGYFAQQHPASPSRRPQSPSGLPQALRANFTPSPTLSRPLPTSMFDPPPPTTSSMRQILRQSISFSNITPTKSTRTHGRSQSAAINSRSHSTLHPPSCSCGLPDCHSSNQVDEEIQTSHPWGLVRSHDIGRRSSVESLSSDESMIGAPSGARTPVVQSGPESISDEVRRLGTDVGVMGIDENDMAELNRKLADRAQADEIAPPSPEVKLALERSTKQYVESHNRLLAGERTVIVLNSKIAQRSYGSEKRFLCPQPMALLLGANWWSNVESAGDQGGRVNKPPEVYISISTDATPSTEMAATEWMDMSGDRVSNPDNEQVVISGRAIGKSNYVSTNNEPNNREKVVRSVVTIVAPGSAPSDQRLIGIFTGKPMTVISKPSKRRQTSSSCITVQHGGLVSLYNRLKSQTGSTRFLGVSGLSSSFPTMDWRAMAGGSARPYSTAHSATFIARSGSWDPFVIYAVDLNFPPAGSNVLPSPPPFPGFPRPPVNAIPVDINNPKGIYYNMPVVLQCFATAVVSPVMIIRKIETKSTAIGGGSIDGYTPRGAQHLPCAPGELLGEPISQFRPLCLELYNDQTTDILGNVSTCLRPQNSFLACLGDTIGVNQSREVRKYLPPLENRPNRVSVPISPMSPLSPAFDHGMGGPGDIPNGVAAPFVTQEAMPEYPDVSYPDDISAHGAKVKRVRRGSASSTASTPYPIPLSTVASRPISTLAKHKRRVASLSNLAQIKTDAINEAYSTKQQLRWTIDCGDPCVWTIAGIDLTRHTIFIPPEIVGGRHSSLSPPPANVAPFYKTLVPSHPIRSVPAIFEYETPLRPGGGPGVPVEDTMIALYGENFSPSLQVWMGSDPCPAQFFKSPSCMLVKKPARPLEHHQRLVPLRFLVIRKDGVVFPSPVFYREA